MPFFLLVLFALLAAILFNFGAPRFYATSVGTKLQTSFFGATAATALVLLGVIILAAWFMASIGEEVAVPSLPSA